LRPKDFPKAWALLKRQAKGFDTPWVEEDSKRQRDPFRVLIACIISLRTQDKVTAEASERLFQRANTPKDMLRLSPDEIASLIYPAGFYRTKGKRIFEICSELCNKYGSKVPERLEDLLNLKGVGRKTANLVISIGFGRPAICVDTHVHRIPNRWGLIDTSNPKQSEIALKTVIPKRYWIEINRYLVTFGQNICKPISPLCSRCSILEYCNRKGVFKDR